MPCAYAMRPGEPETVNKSHQTLVQLPLHSIAFVDRKRAAVVKEPGRHWIVSSRENCFNTAVVSGHKASTSGEDPAPSRSPLKVLANLPRPPGLGGAEQDMLRQKMIISEPTMDLGVRDPNKVLRSQLGTPQRPPPPNKANVNKVCNIKDKISEWEGKRETPSPLLSRKEGESGRKEDPVIPLTAEKKAGNVVGSRNLPPRRLMSWELESKENDSKAKGVDKKLECKEKRDVGQAGLGKGTDGKGGDKREAEKDIPSVLCQVKLFEQVLKDGPAEVPAQFPGTYYSPQGLQEKVGEEPSVAGGKDRLATGQQRKPFNNDGRADEPVFGSLGNAQASGMRGRNLENAYTEPAVPDQKPFINPLPKPRRTFRHDGEEEVGLRPTADFKNEKRSLPPLPSIPPPPLPSSPPPAVSRRRWNGKHKTNADHRKSYEFEDLPQSALENHRAGWCKQNTILTRTLSEENVYEDILDTPSKENPYEDIEIDGQFLGKKYASSLQASPTSSAPSTPNKIHPKPAFFRQNSDRRSFKLLELRKVNRDGATSPLRGTSPPPSIPSSPDEAFFNSADLQNGRRRRKISRLVLKINAIFEARRGKKRVKRLSQSTENSSGKVTDDNSESDSDTEEKRKAHSQRLVHVKSRLSQTPRYQTLERELLEYRKRQLFEYFVVVSLKKPVGDLYTPEVTQQFPLQLERSFKFMREAEDQLKAIPQFCFPDAKDWRPVDQFVSETFSFVLTGEDGSRRFGYCRRLLPGSKGKRLPEVYCIVSRLGCFNLFSKILDEVEKRRSISPALVQPFMRSIIDAPFPALGRTITVKNFLPGSGNEVIELYRPLDSRLEHVDFECLFASLSVRHLLRVFASLLLERRVIFMADTLSTLSKCCHAVVALIYPFAWQHTYIPVLPPSMIDIVCSPTPFLIGLLSSSLPRLKELPVEEVLVVDLVHNRFLRQMDDEDSILPRKLQAALEQILEQRNELFTECIPAPLSARQDSSPLNEIVSESFVRFFVEVVGHYSLFLVPGERDEKTLHREAFRKSVSSKSLRRFLEVFMETQMFGGFIQDRELQKQGSKGLFEMRAQEYLETLPSSKQRGVDKFLKGLGNKMRRLHKR